MKLTHFVDQKLLNISHFQRLNLICNKQMSEVFILLYLCISSGTSFLESIIKSFAANSNTIALELEISCSQSIVLINCTMACSSPKDQFHFLQKYSQTPLTYNLNLMTFFPNTFPYLPLSCLKQLVFNIIQKNVLAVKYAVFSLLS